MLLTDILKYKQGESRGGYRCVSEGRRAAGILWWASPGEGAARDWAIRWCLRLATWARGTWICQRDRLLESNHQHVNMCQETQWSLLLPCEQPGICPLSRLTVTSLRILVKNLVLMLLLKIICELGCVLPFYSNFIDWHLVSSYHRNERGIFWMCWEVCLWREIQLFDSQREDRFPPTQTGQVSAMPLLMRVTDSLFAPF